MIEVLILVLVFFVLLGIGVPVAWSIGISCLLTIMVILDCRCFRGHSDIKHG